MLRKLKASQLTSYQLKQRLRLNNNSEIWNRMSDYNQMQELNEETESKQSKQTQSYKPRLIIKVLVGYLYFIQGIILSLPETMGLVYSVLPTYSILSLFSVATLPFSFKFITAPFIQKFTSVSYGKRKFWIILSQILASVMLYIGSFFTSIDHQVLLALLLIISVFFITLQDISLDAMAIKEIRVPHIVGLLQAVMQTTGYVFGSLFLLKMTSAQFASKVGLEHSITTAPVIYRLLSISILVPSVMIHFLYRETILESQKKIKTKSLCEVIKYYSIFLDHGSKYFRTALLFLIMVQGFNMFWAGYEYQLVKHGFSRNTLNTFMNLSLLPVSLMACLFTSKLEEIGLLKMWLIYLVIREVSLLLVLLFFPVGSFWVFLIVLMAQTLEVLKFLLGSIMVNLFPVIGISGMYITMMVSFMNFGALKTFPLWLTGKIGWELCAVLGLLLQLFIILFYNRLYDYVESGHLELAPELTEETQKKNNSVELRQVSAGHEITNEEMMQERKQ